METLKEFLLYQLKRANDNQLFFGDRDTYYLITHYFVKNWIKKELFSNKCVVMFDFDSEYKEICKFYDGNYIEVSEKINVNPFAFEGKYKGDFNWHLTLMEYWLQILLKREFKGTERNFIYNQLELLYQPTYAEGEGGEEVQVKNPHPTLQLFVSLLEKSNEMGNDIAKELQPFVQYFSIENSTISLKHSLNVFSFSNIGLEVLPAYLFSFYMFMQKEIPKWSKKSIRLSIGYGDMEPFAENEILFRYVTRSIEKRFWDTTYMANIYYLNHFTDIQMYRIGSAFHNVVFFPSTEDDIKIMKEHWYIEEEISKDTVNNIHMFIVYCNGIYTCFSSHVELQYLKEDFFKQ